MTPPSAADAHPPGTLDATPTHPFVGEIAEIKAMAKQLNKAAWRTIADESPQRMFDLGVLAEVTSRRVEALRVKAVEAGRERMRASTEAHHRTLLRDQRNAAACNGGGQ